MDIKGKLKSFFEKLWDKIKHFNIQDYRVSFVKGMESLQANGRALYVTVIAAVILMLLVCLAVFFATVKGPEEVLVPNVEGKELTQALIEMQVKELYPKVQLRYDEQPSGTILNQSPDGGAIVKAGTRVTLTVSRGAVVSEVGEYIGQNYDNLKIDLTTMFTGSRALIVLADPVYKADLSDAGTILEQDPPAGTKISDPVKVQLVVSRGPNFDKTRIPNLTGKSIDDLYKLMESTKLVFDFTSTPLPDARGKDQEAVVVGQQQVDQEFVSNYSRVQVEIGFPSKNPDGDVYGIFEAQLAQYPYAVAMTVECIEKNGQRYQLASLSHTGGSFTLPYSVPAGSELVLRIAGKEEKRITAGR